MGCKEREWAEDWSSQHEEARSTSTESQEILRNPQLYERYRRKLTTETSMKRRREKREGHSCFDTPTHYRP